MAFQHTHILGFIIILLVGSLVTAHDLVSNNLPSHYCCLNRTSFPSDFLFGTASSAYQIEGGANEGGRGPSIWDTYAHKYPEKIKDHSNGDIALDSYHRYQEDVAIMKDLNMDAYRFSISWSRVLPKGKLCGGINQEGIAYYNKLIDELVAKGIKPFATLFHWDVPQALEDEYGGFRSPKIVDDFRDYVDLCFKHFGDRVKHWITLNEPVTFCTTGYVEGAMAPGRCSEFMKRNCTGGDSATEPYFVAHYQLLAHAAAVCVFRDKYKVSQRGEIGITLVSSWFLPFSQEKQHIDAVDRALEFMYGWFMEPLTTGDYPRIMRTQVGNRLPQFTKEESNLLRGSFDFIGLNYYSSNYATDVSQNPNPTPLSYSTDSRVSLSALRNGIPIGKKAHSDWLFVYPKGIHALLLYTRIKYNNPIIYITENGIDEANDPNLPLEEALVDTQRIDYYYRHIDYVRKAINDGVKVKGYFAWSLADNYEWGSGYTSRFGINFIDYKDGLKRYPKLSACWFKNFLSSNKITRKGIEGGQDPSQGIDVGDQDPSERIDVGGKGRKGKFKGINKDGKGNKGGKGSKHSKKLEEL